METLTRRVLSISCLMFVLPLLNAGCNQFGEGSGSLWSARKPGDYADPTAGADEPWVAQAGREARGDRPKETATEPRWFREAIMSDRAREIERNVGIYD